METDYEKVSESSFFFYERIKKLDLNMLNTLGIEHLDMKKQEELDNYL